MTKAKGGRGIRAPNKYKLVAVTMPPELAVKLDQFAAAYGVSRSEMMRHALLVFMDREPLPSE